jgi:hypothetical protein
MNLTVHLKKSLSVRKIKLFYLNLIKLFWSKFTHSFCKQDTFINISHIHGIDMNRSSLQNRVSKFIPKIFMRLTPGQSGDGDGDGDVDVDVAVAVTRPG